MFFSRRLIESLVLTLASETRLHAPAVRNLLYHLTLPGPQVPFAIADTIADHPEMGADQTRFPPRLAFGVIEGGLFVFDRTIREDRQRKLVRKISLIRFGLSRQQFPDGIIDLFEKRLNELHVASLAAQDLALQDRPLLAAEGAALTERLIESCMAQKEVTLLLLERLAAAIARSNRLRLAERARDAVESGLQAPPWDDLHDSHVVLAEQEPACFRRSLFELPAFSETAQTVVRHLDYVAKG